MTKNNSKAVCFIGGDERQKYAARELSEYIKVNTAGSIFESIKQANIQHFESASKAIFGASAIILPLPAATSEYIIPFSELASQISRSEHRPIIFGGKFSPYLKGILENYDLKHYDYYEDECFTLKNAYLTAEGAVQLAMANIKGAIRFSKCAVIGYGRIGKALGDMLLSLRAEVTVLARREEALVLARENGLRTAQIPDKASLEILANDFDVIFNTVPERILPNDLLLAIPSKTIIAELASPPGGLDPDIAIQCGISFIDGRGLPGKYAPESAGKTVAEAIIKYLKKEELL